MAISPDDAGTRLAEALRPEIDDRIRGEMLALFVLNAPMATVASVLNVLVMAYVMSDLVPASILRSWVAAQIALGVLRWSTTALYKRRGPDASQSSRWIALFAAGVILQAIGWSVAGSVFFVAGTEVARTFIAVMLAGMVAGGVSVLSPLRRAASAWVCLLVIPEVIVCFYLGGLWLLFGGCALLFTLTQLVAVQHAHRGLVASVRMAVQNQDLVTSLSRTNVELAEARDAAMRAAQAKADFLANMSHEIRTPMTSILGYADLIRGADEPSEIAGYSEAIQRNGKHLLVLINDILDLSKIEAGKLVPEWIECAPTEIIRSAVAMLQDAARTAKLELVCTLSPLPRQIRSDPVRLRQILVNLISNALKFTPAGEVRVEASLDRKDERALLEIRVIDTGIGMTPEQLGQIFKPFTQADAGIARRYGGTGLGLSISRHLAQLLGGTLSATSEPDRGSCFELLLDVGAWDDVRLEDESGQARVAPTERYVAARFAGRVLLAEDGVDNRRLIRILLQKRGLSVDLAENGRIAIEQARRSLAEGRVYDLVLMDIQMPEMDGATATRALKAEAFPAPIVALTAQALEGDRERFMHAGFDAYESKPIEPARLDRLLSRFLRHADT